MKSRLYPLIYLVALVLDHIVPRFRAEDQSRPLIMLRRRIKA